MNPSRDKRKKYILLCKVKKCKPPIQKWVGSYAGTLRAKVATCVMCKHLKIEKEIK